MGLIVRRETEVDRARSEAVTAAAFAGGPEGEEPVEVGILRALRRCDEFIPQLSLVAELDGEIVGHVICTGGELGSVTTAGLGPASAVGLGPISVDPAHEGQGVGAALMHAVVAAAEALDVRVVVLLGDGEFYGRFGFVDARDLGIESPVAEWTGHLLARPLAAWDGPVEATFRYAAPLQEA